ncbi:MAG TPA: CotH kinase family protein [Verrucomicrobiae bacterium]|nr:CotH kinase family protein [Verrucomicrobiae bacterium]
MPQFASCLCGLLVVITAQAAEFKPPKHSTPPPDWLVSLKHSPEQPRSGQQVQVTAQVTATMTNLTLLYQVVDPGAYIELQDAAFTNKWVSAPMLPAGESQNVATFHAEIPASVQKHRRLIRYRVRAQSSSGRTLVAPDFGMVPPNLAYFVYDGIPSWTGAIDPRGNDSGLAAPMTFPPEEMRRVQAYHLLGKRRSIENASWREPTQGKEYRYTGTLVVDGEVFDHVGYRARGGVWRYAMIKNMWKFYLPGDHDLQARDDFGMPYKVHWNKINLRACIQQGDYGQRGEQGMFESVGFRLFNLAGVPAPRTHWIQLRIVDEPNENPPDQYRGDFWGLYLAIENEDSRFLKEHGLPSGNLFKMEGGGGELQHHGPGAVTNLSDLFGFMNDYMRPNTTDPWWKENFDLTNFYSYRAICECIHHYDVDQGKNYDYYHNPQTGRWEIIPWDIDLTWADNMYGSGEDPFKRRVLSRSNFRRDYQNRVREIRDLLFNPEQTGQIIDEYASVIWRRGSPSIVEADRRKWDYHPMMAMGMKAGQGLFYRASRTHDFPGMLEEMKEYVRNRGEWIDSVLLGNSVIPETPKVKTAGPSGFPCNQLRFTASEYRGSLGFAGLKWRMAEVAPPLTRPDGSKQRMIPEIQAVWESPELADPSAPVSIPAGVAHPGRTYRVRAKMKDTAGSWSHWSAPVEFVAQ